MDSGGQQGRDGTGACLLSGGNASEGGREGGLEGGRKREKEVRYLSHYACIHCTHTPNMSRPLPRHKFSSNRMEWAEEEEEIFT